MNQTIHEGRAKIHIVKTEKISKQMPVFYNPVMKLNRDISILLLNSLDKNNMQIADLLAGSGIRSLRFLLELNKDKIKEISVNDYSKGFLSYFKKSLRLNKIKINDKIIIKSEDANLFLLNSSGFDYIDIDPFGTPNPFLDSAAKRLSREGILAVTATDTAPLCGTYPEACQRKYWAVPLRNELMHEIGLRILIRKIQLIAMQYDKALTPIFSYYKDHYFKVFLKCEKGTKEVDEIIKQHGTFENAGPLWIGSLWDEKLVEEMVKNSKEESYSLLRIIKEESKINTIGFYNTSKIAERNHLKTIPKKQIIIEKIRKLGYKASETHFDPEGIKTDIKLNMLIKLIR
ncbi:MAG: tRNA (guanine(26)-N(2))-dimethyltransferase [Candidatus Woesearchaeota archaeon]|nr:tRNA (guanine(26)-N(2))-dimethyltransferase [Candidatus Woesearchaeota archaeon]